MSKKDERLARERYNDFLKSNISTLYQAYKVPSGAKVRVYEKLLTYASTLNANRFRIISYNCDIFTVGFTYTDTVTEQEHFVYITPYRQVDIIL